MSLKIKNFTKKYEDTWILKDVSFEIEQGEILGLFGASGSGKSVLIRLIAGLEKSDTGSLLFLEDNVTEFSCEKRGFQFPNLSSDSFWQKMFGTNKPTELADGEGQLLALENALHEVEGVLLLDNSFCKMDRLERNQSYAKLKSAAREKNLIVIFATNDYEEIFKVCDRAVILQGGAIEQIGTPFEIYTNPASKAVVEIFGDANLFPARRLTSKTAEVPEFITLDGEHRLTTGKLKNEQFAPINQNCFLAVRPEHISISFGASFPEDNLIKATITDVQFKGATTEIYLDASGLKLKTLVLRLVGLNVGDECVIGIPPDRIMIF